MSFRILLSFGAAWAANVPVTAQDTPPVRKEMVQPVFPHLARIQALSGNVVVKFVITKSGSVEEIEVIEATADDFKKPAIDCVRKWRFVPGMQNGKRVATRVRQRLEFALDGSPAELVSHVAGGFSLKLNEEWKLEPAPYEEQTKGQALHLRKGSIYLSVKATKAGEGMPLKEFAAEALDDRNEAAAVVDGFRLFKSALFASSFRRVVAGELREGVRIPTHFVDERGGDWVLWKVFRFADGNDQIEVVANYPYGAQTTDILTLGEILGSLAIDR